MPLGKKPPCDQRWLKDAVSPASEKPRVITPTPMRIMPMIAVTLTIENQNSSSPKSFTEIRLTQIEEDGEDQRGDPLRDRPGTSTACTAPPR